ncbi:TPA: SLATT domain-containing protein [Candidatus Poribacteria bacterium]|nr:SLATT domain-containing protein [Candidatus Poribacteria bacterium]
MEQPTHPNARVSQDEHRALEAQIRESYGRVAYSHKAHEKSADIYHGRLQNLKLAQIILSAITTGGIIITLFGESRISTVIAAITSTVLLTINTYTKEHDLGELAQKHASVAGDLWNAREAYLSLLTDLASRSAPAEEIRKRRDKLQETLKNIYKAAPRTIPKAYSAAQAALKINEELTFSEEEIDNMLPPYLRRGSTQEPESAQQRPPADAVNRAAEL